MEKLLKQIKEKQMRTSSQLNLKQNCKNEDLVFLINSLNSDIKLFYQSIKKCLKEGKQINSNTVSTQKILDLIEQYLNDFIDKAKDKFKKMKYIRKINIIQQDINEHQDSLNVFSDYLMEEQNKMKLSSDDIFKRNNNDYNTINNVNSKLINKKIFDDAFYFSNIYNNNTNTSMKINNIFDNNNNYNDEQLINNDIGELSNDHNYKHIYNYSYNNNKKTNNNATNFNIRKNTKYYNNKNNANKSNENNALFYNYNQYKDKNSKKTKSVHDLRKKIIIKRKAYTSNPDISHYYSANNTQPNMNSTKKEILNNLNGIISLLKEIKKINGNIFNKTWEAEQHHKLLNKLYNELNNLISNMFKENTNYYSDKENYPSGKVSNKSLKKANDKLNSSGSCNLTGNFDTINNSSINNNKDKEKEKMNLNKIKTYYEKEIQNKDLIITKLKEDLNVKDKRIQQQNLKYTQLKSILNNKKEDNLKLNNISKMNIEELIQSRQNIIELEEKLKKYENINTKNNNMEKHFNLINQKYNELKKVNELINSNNRKLKEQINLLYNQLDINRNKKSNFTKLENISLESFSIISNIFSVKAQTIIDELKNEIKTKNEINEKINNEINNYKKKEINLKDEISKLNNDMNANNEESIKLKEEINKLNEEINKNKEEINKIKKEKEFLEEKKNEFISENKKCQETIDKQKKLLSFQEEEINALKDNKAINKSNIENKSINNDIDENNNSLNNINKEDKKNKKRNNIKQIDQLQIEQDKIVLKYELLKNDYDKLNTTLQQKQKLLDNYSKLSSETSSKANIDEQILELIAQHKKEMDDLTQKYNQNIINLKMNLPIGYSPKTHSILIDKKYSKYNLRWLLLTISTVQEKNYENTFWVPEEEIKPILSQFNTFRTEKELEDEQIESIYITQQKWIKQIDENERLIAKLQQQLQKYENNNTTN